MDKNIEIILIQFKLSQRPSYRTICSENFDLKKQTNKKAKHSEIDKTVRYNKSIAHYKMRFTEKKGMPIKKTKQ